MMRSGDSSITWRRNPVESAGAGAASVDERRCAALSRHLDRFDTERGPAPVADAESANQGSTIAHHRSAHDQAKRDLEQTINSCVPAPAIVRNGSK